MPLSRRTATEERTLEAVGSMPLFGLVTPACLHWVSCTAAVVLGLCRTLKDRHDLHHTALGIIPELIRDALFQIRRSDNGPDGCPF